LGKNVSTERLTTNADFDAQNYYKNGTAFDTVYVTLGGADQTITGNKTFSGVYLDMGNNVIKNVKLNDSLDANYQEINNIGPFKMYLTGNKLSEGHLSIGTSSTTITKINFLRWNLTYLDAEVNGLTLNANLDMNTGNINDATNVYASKFYDKDGTNYWLDPANTSTSLQLAGKAGIACQSPAAQMEIRNTGVGDSLIISSGTLASQRQVVVTAEGNVGINTSAPTKTLEIHGAGTPIKFDTKTGYVEIYAGDSLVARIKP
ncbi:hypothetical protein KJ633_06635, partial [bacterium]|nr:hypothetical protein [bacterium]